MLIETRRLRLRELAIGDLDEFVEMHRDAEVVRFVRALDRAQARERLSVDEREWELRGHGIFAVLERSNNRFLGRVGLKYWPQFQETEVGWVLCRDAWGRGYATEAAGACLEWGFTTLPVAYFTAMIAPRNERSIRVAQRLGFEPAREDLLLGDPVIVYRLARDAWSGAAAHGTSVTDLPTRCL